MFKKLISALLIAFMAAGSLLAYPGQHTINKVARLAAGTDAMITVMKRDIAGAAAQDTTSTLFVLPTNSIVLDIYVYIGTADSGWIDIGTNTDLDGFADSLRTDGTGFKRPMCVVDSVYRATNTRGALLSTFGAGTGEDSTGVYLEYGDVSSGGDTVKYVTSDSTGSLDGEIWLIYMKR